MRARTRSDVRRIPAPSSRPRRFAWRLRRRRAETRGARRTARRGNTSPPARTRTRAGARESSLSSGHARERLRNMAAVSNPPAVICASPNFDVEELDGHDVRGRQAVQSENFEHLNRRDERGATLANDVETRRDARGSRGEGRGEGRVSGTGTRRRRRNVDHPPPPTAPPATRRRRSRIRPRRDSNRSPPSPSRVPRARAIDTLEKRDARVRRLERADVVGPVAAHHRR